MAHNVREVNLNEHMTVTELQTVIHLPSEPPPKRQFSLAQLFAIVVAASAVLAFVRLFWQDEPPSTLALWLIFGGFVLATVLLFITGLRRLGELMVIATALVGLAALVVPAIPRAQQAARRSVCQGYLKQIVVALHYYHEIHGCFPPAVVRDESGRPLHSWRVLLLPYMEQQSLYASYRFDEPWDGPNNKKLHTAEMPYYSCPEHASGRGNKPPTDTCYVVAVGPHTAFPENRCVSLSDISDDKGNTLLVVEVVNSGIHWMEPRDLHVTQMARQINPPRGQGISSLHGPHPPGGANAVMVDGTVKFLDADQTADQIEAMLTIAGDEP